MQFNFRLFGNDYELGINMKQDDSNMDADAMFLTNDAVEHGRVVFVSESGNTGIITPTDYDVLQEAINDCINS